MIHHNCPAHVYDWVELDISQAKWFKFHLRQYKYHIISKTLVIFLRLNNFHKIGTSSIFNWLSQWPNQTYGQRAPGQPRFKNALKLGKIWFTDPTNCVYWVSVYLGVGEASDFGEVSPGCDNFLSSWLPGQASLAIKLLAQTYPNKKTACVKLKVIVCQWILPN